MTTNRRHTNAEIRAAIDALEARGWSINADGTITRTQARQLHHDPRAKNAAPRYLGEERSDRATAKSCLVAAKERPDATIKRSDLVAARAKFGLVAAKERPHGHTSTSTLSRGAQGAPSARSNDPAAVTSSISWCAISPLGIAPNYNARCGGQVVGRISTVLGLAGWPQPAYFS